MRTLGGSQQAAEGATDEVTARPDTGPAEPSDQALVRAAQGGSTGAFEELYRRHASAAWRVARAVTRNPDDASDAVAEAVTRVFKALPSGCLGGNVAFRPYLLAAVRNAAIDGLRKSGRLRPTDTMDRFDGHAPAPGPSERLMIGDDRLKMAEAFATLPERWRTVLWMTEVEEMPARDVARLLGLTPNGVSQLAVRARAGLRDRYLQAHVRNNARPVCVHTVEHLGAYVGGGLAPRDIAKVDQHLAGCADCRDRLIEVEDVGSTLRRIVLPIPVGLSALALEQFHLRALPTAVEVPRRILPSAGASGLHRAVAAGASALVIGLGGMAFLAPTQPAPTPVTPALAAAPAPTAEAAPPTSPPQQQTGAPPAVSTPAAPASATPPLPALPVPPLPQTHVPLPPLPVPVEASAGIAVAGLGAGVSVGQCTGVVVGPVTAGCAPAPPGGTGVQVDVPGVIELTVL